jgi:V-type H+-transporting ATPase subunit a
MKKICEGYRASIFPCSNDHQERFEVMEALKIRTADMQTVVNHTKNHRQRALNAAAGSFFEWSVKLKKLKCIFHTMSMFKIFGNYVRAECWAAKADISLLENALCNGSSASNSTLKTIMNVIASNETPPTYNRTNKFTQAFQNLIDAYGVASYREVNPAFYTIVTFPFLFSVMFGDVGHGIIMSLVGGWLVLSEKKLSKIKEEIFKLFFGGRYIILMMGLFSIYSGFIYNDMFAKSLNIFGSSWRVSYNTSTIMTNAKLQLNVTDDNFLIPDRTYPMGLDPVWQVADNKIIFLNSFKMKLSIIFGVVHMILGLSISVINSKHFRKTSLIILEFVPQVTFLLLLFGYLVFMIFFKWIKFSGKTEQPFSPGCAPSVLVYFINMMLFNKNKALDGCQPYMYPGQSTVQTALLVAALLCVPWLLLSKPLYIKYLRNKKIVEHIEGELESSNERVVSEEEEPMSDVWTHQAIHTIEFVLGTVSHTASYLRLWALSLAHARKSLNSINLLIS